MIKKEKLVLFGAGRIGRSFIGQLCSRSGFEVVFVDINEQIINVLNQEKAYQVVIKSDQDEILRIEPVRGIHAGNRAGVEEEVAGAGIVAVSTGIDGLPGVFGLLAGGLMKRYERNPDLALDIIIAENLRNADQYFSSGLKKHLPPDYPLDKLVGLIETSIGKMVPIMPREEMLNDPLRVYAEPYNTLILDGAGFKNSIPEVAGLAPKEHIKAWVDRKLFIHNLGHAAAAYLGNAHHPDYTYIYEVLDDAKIRDDVRSVMKQSAVVLLRMYPDDFTDDFLLAHIDDLLHRFGNRSLGDTIFRVGTGLMRKLGPEDRIVAPVKAAVRLGLPYDLLLRTLVFGCRFSARDEQGKANPEDEAFAEVFKLGIEAVLKRVCGLEPLKYADLYKKAIYFVS
jgi:mannitol-1-phosphate 5-dehydrogenase